MSTSTVLYVTDSRRLYEVFPQVHVNFGRAGGQLGRYVLRDVSSEEEHAVTRMELSAYGRVETSGGGVTNQRVRPEERHGANPSPET